MPILPASASISSSVLRGWSRVFLLVFLLNAAFLAALLLAAALPTESLRARTIEAFREGSLSREDYLPFDMRVGWHQYNDCLILHMISNEDGILRKSIGPLVYHRDDYRYRCATVEALVNGEDPTNLGRFRYTRYWHGHNALTAVLLSIWDLGTVRWVLRSGAYLSLVLLALVSLRSGPQLRLFGLGMAIVGSLFWGLPYFAQSPSHGPGDTAVVLGFVALLALSRRPLGISAYLPLCAGFGAVLTYMEFLTGLLPTAAAFLLPIGYYVAGAEAETREALLARWRFAILGALAFGVGALLTILLKQLLAVALFGDEAIQEFSGNLQYYVQTPEVPPENRVLASIYTVAAVIGRSGDILTYGSFTGAVLLFGSSVMAWLGSLILAIRARSRASRSSLSICAAGALLVYLWVVLLPTHTYNHPYMVRMMIGPLALGWIALLLQWGYRSRSRGGSASADAATR